MCKTLYVLRGLAVSSHPARFSSSSMCLFCHARTPYHRRPLLFLSSAPPNLTCPLSRLSGTCVAEMGRSWEVVNATRRGGGYDVIEVLPSCQIVLLILE